MAANKGAASKGYDDSPPRNGVILFYTVLTVVVLIGVQQLLDSYFARMMDAEIHEKVLTRGFEQVHAAKAHEREALEKSGIDQAMRTFAQRGRAASPVLAAESGAGKQAVPGWSQLKRQLPAAEPEKPAEVVPQPAPAGDASPVPSVPGTVPPQPGNSPVAPAGRPAPASPTGAPH